MATATSKTSFSSKSRLPPGELRDAVRRVGRQDRVVRRLPAADDVTGSRPGCSRLLPVVSRMRGAGHLHPDLNVTSDPN